MTKERNSLAGLNNTLGDLFGLYENGENVIEALESTGEGESAAAEALEGTSKGLPSTLKDQNATTKNHDLASEDNNTLLEDGSRAAKSPLVDESESAEEHNNTQLKSNTKAAKPKHEEKEGSMQEDTKEARVKREIVTTGKLMHQRGFAPGHDGNISVRVNRNSLWVTPTGVSKGALHEDQLVQVNLEGKALQKAENSRKATSELDMHLRIYRENPEVKAVVHAHPPIATAFSAAGLSLNKPVLAEVVVELGKVPLVPFALPGTKEVADAIAPYCLTHHAVLLEFHGAVAWGTSLEEAWNRMESVEHFAQVLLSLRMLQSERVLSHEQIAALLQSAKQAT